MNPIHDDRIMSDGRPAHAWWCELEMLRNREPEFDKTRARMREQMIILRIADWAIQRDPNTDDFLLRIRRDLTSAKIDPAQELMNNPGKYVSIEKRKP